MIRRKTPFGYRTCQLCGKRMIRGDDLACTWCLREMGSGLVEEYARQFWSVRFLIPDTPKTSATPSNEKGRAFISQVRFAAPDLGLTAAPIEVIAKVATHRKVELIPVGLLIIESLKQAGIIMYHDQVRILSLGHESSAHPRTEITVRILHPDEIDGG